MALPTKNNFLSINTVHSIYIKVNKNQAVLSEQKNKLNTLTSQPVVKQ